MARKKVKPQEISIITPVIDEMLKLFDSPDPRPSVFLPKNTPLMVSGFTSAGLAYLNEQLAPFALNAYAAPGGQGDFSYVKLEPGSSIGVELVKGDINLGAIGTVTWTDDDGKILAFGHPFLQNGNSRNFYRLLVLSLDLLMRYNDNKVIKI